MEKDIGCNRANTAEGDRDGAHIELLSIHHKAIIINCFYQSKSKRKQIKPIHTILLGRPTHSQKELECKISAIDNLRDR